MSAPTRRYALGFAGSVAAFAAAGRLPLLGAGAGVPVGLSPIQGYLGRHALVGNRPAAASQSYAVLRWRSTAPDSGETVNEEIGRLEMHTRRLEDQACVKVIQTTRYSQPQNRMEAEIVCNLDPILSLRSWTLVSAIESRDDCRYEVSGRREGDVVRIDDGMSERAIAVEGPLVSQWTLALATAAAPSLRGRFGLLEDLLLYKPGQRLVAESAVRIPFQDGSHELSCHAQRGPGVLPVHYFSDPQGHLQLVTQGALGWALAEAS